MMYNIICTVLYSCKWRGRSKFLIMCPIPVVIFYNKNMFKSNRFYVLKIFMQFSEKLNTGDVKKSKKIKNTQHKYYLFHFLNPTCSQPQRFMDVNIRQKPSKTNNSEKI